MKTETENQAGERTPRAAIITAGGWEEKAALEGSLTFGQTREVLATVIEQRDALLTALRFFKAAMNDGAKSKALLAALGSARAAIAKAEGRAQ